jgi:hypothetical protein
VLACTRLRTPDLVGCRDKYLYKTIIVSLEQFVMFCTESVYCIFYENTFVIDEVMLQDCMDLLKVEEVTYIQEEEDPLLITYPELKAEDEVSCKVGCTF